MFTTKTSPTVTPSSPWTKGKAGAVIAEIRSSPCTQQHGAGREKLIFFEKRKTLWLCSGLFISFQVLQRMHGNRCPPKESPKCLLVRNHWVLRPPICETPIGFCLPTANAVHQCRAPGLDCCFSVNFIFLHVFLLTQQWKHSPFLTVCAEAEGTSIKSYMSRSMFLYFTPYNEPFEQISCSLFVHAPRFVTLCYGSRSLDSATTGQGLATIVVYDQVTTSKGIQLLLMAVEIQLANNRMVVSHPSKIAAKMTPHSTGAF